jgi:hypothetical protein
MLLRKVMGGPSIILLRTSRLLTGKFGAWHNKTIMKDAKTRGTQASSFWNPMPHVGLNLCQDIGCCKPDASFVPASSAKRS